MGTKANISRIVLGLDGSPGSRAAARWCAGLADAMGAQVTAVHGLGKLPEVFRGTSDAVATGLGVFGSSELHTWREDARHSLAHWCTPLREAGVDHQAELVSDDAVHALLHIAERDHADLIVVGVHGHNRLLGGVPYKLAHHAKVPVVFVPGTAEEATQESPGTGQQPGEGTPRSA